MRLPGPAQRLRARRRRADQDRLRQRDRRRPPRRRRGPDDRAVRRLQRPLRLPLQVLQPRSGNEKGSVENKVGCVRRNLFVPVPQLWDAGAFNRRLLERSLAMSDKPHWIKGERELDLFEADRLAMLGLPAKPSTASPTSLAPPTRRARSRSARGAATSTPRTRRSRAAGSRSACGRRP